MLSSLSSPSSTFIAFQAIIININNIINIIIIITTTISSLLIKWSFNHVLVLHKSGLRCCNNVAATHANTSHYHQYHRYYHQYHHHLSSHFRQFWVRNSVFLSSIHQEGYTSSVEPVKSFLCDFRDWKDLTMVEFRWKSVDFRLCQGVFLVVLRLVFHVDSFTESRLVDLTITNSYLQQNGKFQITGGEFRGRTKPQGLETMSTLIFKISWSLAIFHIKKLKELLQNPPSPDSMLLLLLLVFGI